MLPDTGSVVAFFLIVAPGVVFELTRLRRRAPRPDSAFLEAARILLYGVVTALFALSILAMVRLCGAGLLIDPGSILSDPHSYVSSNPGRVLGTAVAYLLVASTLAVLFGDARQPSGNPLDVVSDSAWLLTLMRWRPDKSWTNVSVTMRDGTGYIGSPYVVGTDPLANPELVLTKPLLVRASATSTPIPMSERWWFIVLPASEITSVAVEYVKGPLPLSAPAGDASAAPRSSRVTSAFRGVATPLLRIGSPIVSQPRWRQALYALILEVAVLVSLSAGLGSHHTGPGTGQVSHVPAPAAKPTPTHSG